MTRSKLFGAYIPHLDVFDMLARKSCKSFDSSILWTLLIFPNESWVLCRSLNVEAARAVGMKGIVFQGANELERELRKHGVSW